MAQTNEATRKQRVSSVIRLVASILLFAMAAAVFFTVLDAKKKNETPAFFGHSFFVVVSGSMEPDIHVGEFVLARRSSIETVAVGDDVLFVSLSGSVQGEVIVHRVIEVGEDRDGLYLETKGTNNELPDGDKVRASNFVGKATFHSVILGKFFRFITNIEMLLMIFVVVLIVPMVVRYLVKAVREANSEDKTEKDSDENDKPKS